MTFFSGGISPSWICALLSSLQVFILVFKSHCKNHTKLELLYTNQFKFSSFLDIMLLLSEQNHFSKKNYFHHQYQLEIWLPKISPKFEAKKIFWISKDSTLWCSTDHICMLCPRFGSVIKKLKNIMWSCCHHKRSCLEITKDNLLTFLHPNIQRCPKDHMAESKYSEKPPLSLISFV